jgi:hypothetical protein
MQNNFCEYILLQKRDTSSTNVEIYFLLNRFYFIIVCYIEQKIYRVIQEESASLWEMIVCVILSKKVHINMCPIFDSYGVMTAWNLGWKVTIIGNKRNKIINQHNTQYI